MNATQLSLDEALRRRDAAITRVDEHASEEWKDRALETVYQVCLRKPYLSTNDVWAAGLERPREPRAMGPVMLRACNLKWCVKTGRQEKSRQSTQNARPLAVYASLIHGNRTEAGTAHPVGLLPQETAGVVPAQAVRGK